MYFIPTQLCFFFLKRNIRVYLCTTKLSTPSSVKYAGVEREYIYICNFGLFFKLQISCPNMEMLKIEPYLKNGCPYIENKLNFIPTPGGEREYICNFGTRL